MYEAYWNLARQPFGDAADPAFFYQSNTHRAALLKLRYVVEQGHAAGALIGGPGTGKTFLTSLLAEQIAVRTATFAHVAFPQMGPAELLAYLAVELGADDALVDSTGRLDRVVHQIQRRLALHTAEGRRPVVVVDEAHTIEDPRVFQALALLLNLRQPPHTEFSLILVGDRPLLSQLNRMAALNERIAVKALLSPLTREETARYVLCRLEAAEAGQPVFDASAMQALYELSGGVARKINQLCDLALLVGYAERLSAITGDEIEAVAEELAVAVPD